MFIKLNDSDLIDFFNNEPIMIGDYEEGKYIFVSKYEHGFSLNLIIDIYAQDILVTVSYDNNIVFKGEFLKVISIKKDENREELCIYTETQRIVIKKEKLVGVILEKVK